SIMSRTTSRIGLGATLSSTFYPPYYLARSLGTLDLLSGGRVAWNVVASHGHLEAQNFGLHELPARDARYDYADEVVEAVCRLWESWDADALVLDKQRGVFADPDKVHYVNYHGRWISTPTLMPGMFEQFVRAVVPLLQARGLFRHDYVGRTLREHLQET